MRCALSVLLFAAWLSAGAQTLPPSTPFPLPFPLPVRGGFVEAEAMQLLDIAVELEGWGIYQAPGLLPPPPPPDVGRYWTRRAEGYDPNANDKSVSGGFGPFNSAWRLWQLSDQPVYAVTSRGTIPSWDSIEEDLLTNSLQAEKIVVPTLDDKSIRFRLAATRYRKLDEAHDFPVSEVHTGFSYGLSSVLFDRQYGLLKALRDKVPPGATLLITGHSQGAAVATLLHSFLHYACADDGRRKAKEEDLGNYADCEGFGLGEKHWLLKSYVFAQPKPGNWRYSLDLARIAANAGRFYTVNNYDDPVPQAPFAIQFLSDSFTKQEINALSPRTRLLDWLVKVPNAIRRGFSGLIDDIELDEIMRRRGNLGNEFANGDIKSARNSGSSLNFTPSGNIVGVRAGKVADEEYEKYSPMDDFLREHHLFRYRQLSKEWQR